MQMLLLFFDSRYLGFFLAPRFLASLYVPSSKESRSLLDKFIFYLLRDEVESSLLEGLLNMKITELQKTVRLLWYAQFSFSKMA